MAIKAAASVHVESVQDGRTALDRDDLLIANDQNVVGWRMLPAMSWLLICL